MLAIVRGTRQYSVSIGNGSTVWVMPALELLQTWGGSRMKLPAINWNSLKTRITLLVLFIFIISIWSLLFYSNRILLNNFQQQFGQQQFLLATVLAADINRELDFRLRGLEKVAAGISPALFRQPQKLQKLLEERPIVHSLFNGGCFAIRGDGVTVADFPVATGRTGMNVSGKGWMQDALDGRPAIGKPVIGKMLQVPVFTMAVPVFDTSGKVVGVLAGVVDLSKPNFLDKITENSYGKTGGYLLVAPQYKLIVTATDRKRIMTQTPDAGANPLFDRFQQGFEGYGRSVNSLGMEVLASSKQIPVAGWLLVVTLPVAEAFAPIFSTQEQLVAVTIVLTLLAGCLAWWVMYVQLAPISSAVHTLSLMSDGTQPADFLPVARKDEIGQLVASFNSLLKTLRHREDELRESNSYLDNLFNYANAPIIVWDPSFRITRFNKAFETLTGRKAEEVLGKDISLLFPPDRIESSMVLIRNTLSGERWETVEIPILHINGTVRIVLWNSATICADDDITPVAMIAQGQDITKSKQAEEERYHSYEQLRFVLEGSQLGFWDWNMETGEVVRNEQWAQMLGYTLSEIDFTTSQWTDFIHPEDREKAWTSINDHVEGRTPLHEIEYRMRTKDGQYKWILDRARIVKRDKDGKALRMCGTHTDITERKKAEQERQDLEQQFLQAQKLESLGVLTGGIAHDFNNILAIIMGHCSLAALDYEKAQLHIPEIEAAAVRAAELCRQMLAYAGKSRLTQTRINLAVLVADTVKMLRSTIPRNVSLVYDGPSDLPSITADAGQITQVVMNLIINAAEAIAELQGEVCVLVSEKEIRAEQGEKNHLGSAIPDGCYVCLEVRDNGCGMDQETHQKIFEPFYTTKFTGRGLGMSAVLGIITSHNGEIQLFSEPGVGTIFKVYLPVNGTVDAPGNDAVQRVTEGSWQGSGTVLLVEDEEQILKLGVILLQKLGFTVLEAANGQEALERYRRHAREISLVVTDLGMPVMDGYALLRELKLLDPALPIIITSGFGDIAGDSRIVEYEIAGVLAKPYNVASLQEILKKAFAGVCMLDTCHSAVRRSR